MIGTDVVWRIAVCDSSIARLDADAVCSFNISDRSSGHDLITIAYGRNLTEIRGLIRRPISYWSIDESGSVGRTGQSLGKAITYSAVTELGDVDYAGLFEGIPFSVDKRGNKEIHYRDLREFHPESLTELVDRVSESPFLMVSLPEMKLKPDLRTKWKKPKNAFYVFSAIQRLVQAIEQIDQSEIVIVTFDETSEITDEFLEVLWSDRVIVQMHESYLSELFQISDLVASVTGNAINYPDELNGDLFWKFYASSVNISNCQHKKSILNGRKEPAEESKSDHGLVTTAPSDGGTDNKTLSRNYKKPSSRKQMSDRGLMTTAASDGGADRGTRHRTYKKPRLRRLIR